MDSSSRGKKLVAMCVDPADNGSRVSSPVPSLPDIPNDLWECVDDSDADPLYSPTNDLNTASSDEDEIILQHGNNIMSAEGEESGILGSGSTPAPPVVTMECESTVTEGNIKKTRNIREKRKKGKAVVIKGDTRAARLKNKTDRNLGKSYKTKKGKTVPQRECKPLSKCRMQCQKKFGDNIRNILFKEYWAMGSHNKRVAYIASLITVNTKKVSKQKVEDESKQKHRCLTYTYHLQVSGNMIPICKSCFQKTFNESSKFITNVLLSKNSCTSGITHDDNRGTHEPWHKIPEEVKEAARKHILSLPAYESHYCRHQTTKKYLPPHYTIAKIYEEYLKQENVYKPISKKVYTELFHEAKITIKSLKKDTCQNCDKLHIKLNAATEENREMLQTELSDHQNEADYAYTSKRNDKDICKDDHSKRIYTFDMQQCLPTPDLVTSVAFYKRQLWTFNLSLHDCVSKQAYCHMWHEVIAGRGANQVGSCLYNHLISNIPTEVKQVILYSDTCGGQNKNSHLVAMFFTLLQNSENLEIIDHKFLVPGHTHMECDTDHSLIERTRKRYNSPINHPYDWMQLVRQTGKSQPFIVVEMKGEDFFDYASLYKSVLQQKKNNVVGEKFLWKDVKWLRYKKLQCGVLQYKTSLAPLEPFKEINFKRRGRNFHMDPPLSYQGPNPIAKLKKQNLIELLPYISEVFHDFYKNLPSDADMKDVYPDSIEDEEFEETS